MTPRSSTPRSSTPRSCTPGSRAPESRAPESRAPRSRAPRSWAPRSWAPRSWAPRSWAIAALALCALSGCAAPELPPPDAPAADLRLDYAEAIARCGGASPAPHLDVLSGLLEPASQGRTLADLLAASEHPPDLTCVRPGDRLSIQIPGQPELGRDEVVVPASGEVPIAPEQTVQATGLLVTALEARVSAALAEGFLKVRPQVSVRVLERAPRRVQVLGRVGALTQAAAGEAQASLVDLPLHRPLGVYELLNGARGLSSDADAERLVLVRGDGPARRCYRLSYAALVRAHLAGREAWLEPDDQVVVPRLPDVYVLGSVQLPGRYPLRPGQTVAALLLGAGGPAEPADLAHARLLGPGGRERPAGPDALPAPGEVLFVPGGDKVYVVGPGVRRNGSLLLPPNGLSALQAISEAGWFTETADRDGVVILRRRGQTRARLPVPVTALLEGAQEEGRFRLLPGDTVLVPGGMW